MKCISTATVILLCGSAVFFDRFGASADSRTRGHRGAASSETGIDTKDDGGDGGIAGSVGPDLIAGAITNFASYGSTTVGSVRWTGPLFASNPNGNALRFATLYNFWFDSNTGPVTGSVSLGLFKPGVTGAPATISIAAQVPAAPANPADLNGDGTVNAADLAALLGNWNGSGAGDLDGNGVVGAADLAALLGAWS